MILPFVLFLHSTHKKYHNQFNYGSTIYVQSSLTATNFFLLEKDGYEMWNASEMNREAVHVLFFLWLDLTDCESTTRFFALTRKRKPGRPNPPFQLNCCLQLYLEFFTRVLCPSLLPLFPIPYVYHPHHDHHHNQLTFNYLSDHRSNKKGEESKGK